MFSTLIRSLLSFVQQTINTVLSNDLLAYVFYLNILGILVGVISYIYSLNNTDINSRR